MSKRNRALRFLGMFVLTLPILLAGLRDGDLDAGTWALAVAVASLLATAFASIGGRTAKQ